MNPVVQASGQGGGVFAWRSASVRPAAVQQQGRRQKCQRPFVVFPHGTCSGEDCSRRAARRRHSWRTRMDGQRRAGQVVRTRQLVGGRAADAFGPQPGGRGGLAPPGEVGPERRLGANYDGNLAGRAGRRLAAAGCDPGRRIVVPHSCRALGRNWSRLKSPGIGKALHRDYWGMPRWKARVRIYRERSAKMKQRGCGMKHISVP